MKQRTIIALIGYSLLGALGVYATSPAYPQTAFERAMCALEGDFAYAALSYRINGYREEELLDGVTDPARRQIIEDAYAVPFQVWHSVDDVIQIRRDFADTIERECLGHV